MLGERTSFSGVFCRARNSVIRPGYIVEALYLLAEALEIAAVLTDYGSLCALLLARAFRC